jgi:hypothetical protein
MIDDNHLKKGSPILVGGAVEVAFAEGWQGTTHTSVMYDRSDSQASSAAIVEVVTAVRNDRPLAR